MSEHDEVGVLPAEHFIPQSTRDNYDQIARDAALVNGTTPKAAMEQQAHQFAKQHELDPTAGYDHLARWAADHDPSDTAPVDPAAAAKSRAIESARRDPATALAGDPDVAAAALEGAKAQAEAASNTAKVDVEGGVVPNTGLIPVDATSSDVVADESASRKASPKPAAKRDA